MSENNGLAARSGEIVRASYIGIGVNVLLAGLKALIGLLTRSIAVTLDAVNNLSDALSSIITIVGTKLAGKTVNLSQLYHF
jgi:divalent metal cation (Fe/Co/Zn/Cd) transporter